jgi:TP901 family phage tail tape measure protein
MGEQNLIVKAELHDKNLIKFLADLERQQQRAAKEAEALAGALKQVDASTADGQAAATQLADRFDRASNRSRDLGTTLNQMHPQLQNAAHQLNLTGEKTDGLANSVGQLGKGFAANLVGISLFAQGVVGLGAKVGDFVSDAVARFHQLEQEVANIKSIKPEIDTDRFYTQLSEMQTRVMVDSKELARGAYQIASSVDLGADQILQLTEKTAKGAAASRTDMETWSTAVVGAMNAYGLSIKDVDHIQDVFFHAIKDGVVTGAQLAAGFGPIAQSARLAGVDINDAAAAMVVVTKQGGDASQNLNDLNNFFQKFSTANAQENLEKMGVKTKTATGEFRPMIQILQELKLRLDSMTPSQRGSALSDLFPDLQAQRGLTKLLNDIPLLTKEMQEMKGAAGETNAAYATMMDTSSAKTQALTARVNQLKEAWGKVLDPVSAIAGQMAGYEKEVADLGNTYKIATDRAKELYDITKNRGLFNVSVTDPGIQELLKKWQDEYVKTQDQATATEGVIRHANEEMADSAGLPAEAQAAATAAQEAALAEFTNALQLSARDSAEWAEIVKAHGGDVVAAFNSMEKEAQEALVTRLKGDYDTAQKNYEKWTGSITNNTDGLVTRTERDAVRAAAALRMVAQAYAEVEAALRAANMAEGTVRHSSGERADDPRTSDYTTKTGVHYTGGVTEQDWIDYYKKQQGKDYLGSTAPWLTEKGGGGGKKGSGTDYADNIADAQRKLEQLAAMKRATDAVTQAQDALDNETKKWNLTLGQTDGLIKQLQAAENALVTGHNAPLRQSLEQAQKAYKDFAKESERSIHTMDVRLHELDEQLKQLGRDAKADLAPFEQALADAQHHLEELSRQTRDTDAAYEEQLHALSNQAYELDTALEGLNETLRAQQDELAAITERYDAELIPAHEELLRLKESERQLDTRDHLHEEQVQIENVAAAMANATGAERARLAEQLKGLQERHGLHQQEETLQARINRLEADKERDVRAQQERIKATEKEIEGVNRRKEAIQEEERAIQHRRDEFDYEQAQKALAAQHDVERAQEALTKEQELWKGRTEAVQAYHDKLKEVRDAQAYNDQETERVLSEAVSKAQENYDKWKTLFDNDIADLQALRAEQEKSAKMAEQPFKDALEAAQKFKTELQTSQGFTNQIDTAMDTIAKNTQKAQEKSNTWAGDQERVKAAAEKLGVSMDEAAKTLGIKMDVITTATGDAGKAFDSTKGKAQDFKTQGMDPIAKQHDRTQTGTFANLVFAMWDETQPNSFKQSHDTSLHDAGNALLIFHNGVIPLWHDMNAAADTYLQTLRKIANETNPTGQEPEHHATGGPTYMGRPYYVGEHGPELFVPGQTGYMYPNGQMPDMMYAGGGGMTYVAVSVAVDGLLPRDLDAWRDVARPVGIAVKEELKRQGIEVTGQ